MAFQSAFLSTESKAAFRSTAKQNCPGSVTSYDTPSGNEMGLFYNAPKPTQSQKTKNPMTVMNTKASLKISLMNTQHEQKFTEVRNWEGGYKIYK